MFSFPEHGLSLAILVFTSAVSSGEVVVRILETDPPEPAVLGKMEWLNIRVAYESDQEVAFSPYSYFTGRRAFDENHFLGSGLRPAGSREAAVAIAFPNSRKVDLVKVYAWASGRVIGEASLPVDLTWTGKANTAIRPLPSWANSLGQQEQSDRAKTAAIEEQPWTWMNVASVAMAMLMFSGVPAYVALQVIAFWCLRGGWQRAALVPMILMIPVLVYTIDAYNKESNLWPVVLIFTSPLAAAYLFVIVGFHRRNEKSRRGTAPISQRS